MSVRAAGNVLSAATKSLWRKWDEARQEWRDAKAEEFEQKYLVELQASVDRAGVVFNQIEKILDDYGIPRLPVSDRPRDVRPGGREGQADRGEGEEGRQCPEHRGARQRLGRGGRALRVRGAGEGQGAVPARILRASGSGRGTNIGPRASARRGIPASGWLSGGSTMPRGSANIPCRKRCSIRASGARKDSRRTMRG